MRQKKSNLTHRPLVCSIFGPNRGHLYEPISPGVHLNNPGKRPSGRQERVFFQHDKVSCSEVLRGIVPFVELVPDRSGSANFETIVIGCVDGYQRSAIQACFHLSHNSCEFLVGELDGPHDPLKWVLALLTAASHNPPKLGPRSGMKRHSTFLAVQNSEMMPSVFCWARNSWNSWTTGCLSSTVVVRQISRSSSG